MPLIPLQLPPGVFRNGTEFQASNRWRDANLVRWVEGTMRPVGGWRLRDTVGTTAPRAALAWQDLSGDQRYVAGFHNALKAVNASGTIVDISPTALVTGNLSAAVNVGYSGGFYGSATYGTPRADQGNYSEATTWALDNFGQNLVACSVADGRLLEWALNPANDAVAITNAPTSNKSLVVTGERFLFALGAGGNPRKVQWCDREDNTTWTPSTTNEAGDIELQTSGQIMLGVRTRGQTLILTDQDAHSATYQGPPYVYGFERVGSACGVVSRKAAVAVDEGVFWMGKRGFHLYAGGAVQDVPSEVADYVFNNMSLAQVSKIFGVSNQQFNEIWWYYPSSSSNEIDSYVAYNYAERHWTIGSLVRTAGVDSGVFRNPILFGSDGKSYDHETGLAVDGAVVFVESGPISLGNGDQVMSATKLIPDEATQGDVTATFKTKFYPNDVERSYGPYTMANPVSVRFTGRQIKMRVVGARLADWRVGIMRIDGTAGGLR